MLSSDGLPLYGMDKEAAAKTAAKWSHGGEKMMSDAQSWIEAVLGVKLEGDLQEALKSGVVLCQLVNAIRPGCCAKPSSMSAPFKQMENIGNYIAASESLGVRKDDSFQTVALYENKDMLAVLRQIHQLGATAQKIGFSGPALGAKLADANAREFSADQLKKAAATPTMLGTGSHGHEALIVGAEGLASQQGMFDTSKNIVKAGDAPAATAELCAMGQGSAGCASQEGTFDRSREIVKVHG